MAGGQAPFREHRDRAQASIVLFPACAALEKSAGRQSGFSRGNATWQWLQAFLGSELSSSFLPLVFLPKVYLRSIRLLPRIQHT